MTVLLALLYVLLAWCLMHAANYARNWPTQAGYVLLALAAVLAAVTVR